MPAAFALWGFLSAGAAQEMTLDGTWLIEEGSAPDAVPAAFPHEIPVPGLVHQAQPAFPEVDHYETHEFVWTMKRYGVLPATEVLESRGRTRQARNFFWYSTRFRTPVARDHATLVVNKAQFGTAVWLNGQKVGEHAGCFTPGRFDLTAALDWKQENHLIIRIGAHPGAMAQQAFWGSDGEKAPWTPGIYDHVRLLLSGNPVIQEVQVAPRIASGEIVVQTQLRNYGAACRGELTQRVRTWKGREPAGQASTPFELAAGEEKTLIQTLPIRDAVWWSPDNPFLYTLETGSGGDLRNTRFGMREFRFDPATRMALLNGKACPLRGASITLHRFFGDPRCEGLPWNGAWVRKLLMDIPRRMHWNAFRICIGPAPQDWLDVADEAGLLLQYEFPIWSDRPATPEGKMAHELWREDDITAQLAGFVRDNWNHPSVVIWDASNETRWNFLRDKLVPTVRPLDLSRRPWENGYMEPDQPSDPYETHPYQYSSYVFGKPPYFQLAGLEQVANQKPKPGWQGQHPAIINEYDWLWLHRDGTPTHLTRPVYDSLLGPHASPAERFALNGYLLGALTEFWRSQRRHAGVLYLAYLDGDLPHAFTCDNFRNVSTLELEPRFASYAGEAFKPLGLCLDFWKPSVPGLGKGRYRVLLTNDLHEVMRGNLTLSWRRATGEPVTSPVSRPFEVPALGQTACELEPTPPAGAGDYLLQAEAVCAGKDWSPVCSRRRLAVAPLSTGAAERQAPSPVPPPPKDPVACLWLSFEDPACLKPPQSLLSEPADIPARNFCGS